MARAWRLAGTVGLASLTVLAGLMLLPALFGLERYVITGSSMTGTYDRGSLVFAEPVPVVELRVGDVVTYAPPATAGSSDSLVTHRIASVREDEAGDPVFRTAGDANAEPDPWTFSASGATQPRASFSIPYVGYAFAALSLRWVRMLVIGGPALLIGFGLLMRLWRETGEEARRAREHGAPAAGVAPR